MTIRVTGLAILAAIGCNFAMPSAAGAQYYYFEGRPAPTYHYTRPAPHPRVRRDIYRSPQYRGYAPSHGYQDPVVRRQWQREWYRSSPYGYHPQRQYPHGSYIHGNPYGNRPSPERNFGVRDN